MTHCLYLTANLLPQSVVIWAMFSSNCSLQEFVISEVGQVGRQTESNPQCGLPLKRVVELSSKPVSWR